MLKLDPTNKYAFYNLGYIAQTQGDKGGAETQYNKTLAIDAKYDPALYNLAILKTAAGDNDGAHTSAMPFVPCPQDTTGNPPAGGVLPGTAITPAKRQPRNASMNSTPGG